MGINANSSLEVIVIYVNAYGNAWGSDEYLIVFDFLLDLWEEVGTFFLGSFFRIDDFDISIIA